jgi:hypothetical protein
VNDKNLAKKVANNNADAIALMDKANALLKIKKSSKKFQTSFSTLLLSKAFSQTWKNKWNGILNTNKLTMIDYAELKTQRGVQERITKQLEKIFNSGVLGYAVQKAIMREAVFGTVKFGETSPSTANCVWVFNTGASPHIAKTDQYTLKNIDSMKCKWNVSFKKQTKAYTAYKLIKEENEEIPTFKDIIDESIGTFNGLNEENLDEWDMLKKLKAYAKSSSEYIKDKATEIIQVIADKLQNAYESIINLGKYMFHGLFDFLGITPECTITNGPEW